MELDAQPVGRRQKMIRESGVLDYLIDIIYYPFKNKFYNLQSLNSSLLITRILGYTYTTIRHGIAEYRSNELYASQWLSLILDHAMKTRGYNDIKAGATLTELIDNNKKILENRISCDIIERFIEFLRVWDKDSKYITILRAITICDGHPMTHNQKLLSEFILIDKRTRDDL